MIRFCGKGRNSPVRSGASRAAGLAVLVFFVVLSGLPAQTEGQTGAPAEGQSPGAEGGSRIGLEAAVSMAIRNNLELESQRVSLEGTRRADSLSWNQFLPTITLGAGLSRSNYESSMTAMGPTGPVTVTLPQWGLFGSLDISLNLGVAMFEQMKAAKIEYETGKITYEQARARIERDVRKAYCDILLLQEQISLVRQSYENYQRQASMARTNYRNGLIPEAQYLQAQVQVETTRPQVEQAESGLRLQKAAFANTLGLPLDSVIELEPLASDDNFVPLDVQALVSRAATGNPDVEGLRRQILSLQSTRRQVFFSLYTPSLRLSWGAAPTFGGDPWGDNWFDGDLWPQPLNGRLTIALGFQLNGLIPITSQGQQLRSLDDNIRKMNIGLSQAIRGTELQIYNFVSSLEQARLGAEAQRATVALAERSYRMAEQAYRQGASELQEVRTAETQLFSARVNVLQQQYNYMKGLIDLEYAIGVPFGALSAGAF